MEALYSKFNFPSAKRFYDILKENNIKAIQNDIKKNIAGQAVSQIHKPVKHIKTQDKPIVALFTNEQFQLDLLDYSKYKIQNSGNAWVLVGIDIFTRKGYAQPCKSKTPPDVLNALKNFNVLPKLIRHNDGNEWKGVFKQFLADKNVEDVAVNSRNHHTLGVVDRFARTSKERKYFYRK
jgi:hypothetical protein